MIQNRANSKIVLQAKGLTKVYQTSAGDVEALVGVDLEFGRGEFVAVASQLS
jgi:ABC-type lipoprotein export system ATPase subunit